MLTFVREQQNYKYEKDFLESVQISLILQAGAPGSSEPKLSLLFKKPVVHKTPSSGVVFTSHLILLSAVGTGQSIMGHRELGDGK